MAGARDPAAQRMEELLKCCFCSQTLTTKPRKLSCSHSFCHDCFDTIVATGREYAVKVGTKVPEIFECPICQTEFHVKENESVEKMPSKFVSNNALESLTLQQQVQCIKCQSCKSKDPDTTVTYFCGKCLEAHNNRSDFDDHVVKTIEESAKPEDRTKAREKGRCEKHDKYLKFYCETCETLLCRYCMDLNHPDQSIYGILYATLLKPTRK